MLQTAASLVFHVNQGSNNSPSDLGLSSRIVSHKKNSFDAITVFGFNGLHIAYIYSAKKFGGRGFLSNHFFMAAI